MKYGLLAIEILFTSENRLCLTTNLLTQGVSTMYAIGISHDVELSRVLLGAKRRRKDNRYRRRVCGCFLRALGDCCSIFRVNVLRYLERVPAYIFDEERDRIRVNLTIERTRRGM